MGLARHTAQLCPARVNLLAVQSLQDSPHIYWGPTVNSDNHSGPVLTQVERYRNHVIASQCCYQEQRRHGYGRRHQHRHKDRGARIHPEPLSRGVEEGQEQDARWFVALTGCHRKHAVRLMGQCEDATGHSGPKSKRICDEAVRKALIVNADLRLTHPDPLRVVIVPVGSGAEQSL